MRLQDEKFARLSVLALTLALAGCGVLGSGDRPAKAASSANGAASASPAPNGPAADYPVVLGDPFTIDGMEYVPEDVLNYDVVGYATLDAEGGITASHKTLPLPSYVEVTSLETGKTILVRVERRGPMTGTRLVGLSAGAQAQLGSSEGTPVRVRRVNPPEVERAALRSGQPASERLETPMSLVNVLKRKLPAAGSASLNAMRAKPVELAASAAEDTGAEPEIRIAVEIPSELPEETVVAVAPVAESKPANDETQKSGIIVRAATFSREDNAKKAAEKLDGFVVSAGRFFRVHVGPYPSRGKANAALAKVKAAGYTDARVITAG